MNCITHLLFVTLFGAALSLPSSFNSADVCNSKECQDAANFIKGSLNEDADPCDDFYAFACGGFKKQYPIPKGSQNIDGLSLVQQQLEARQVGLFDDDKLKNHGSKIVRKAKKMYDDCMNGNLGETGRNVSAVRVENQFDSLVPKGMYKSQPLRNTPESNCRQEVDSSYHWVLIRLYLDKYFPIAEQKATRTAILNVRKALRNDVIRKVSWMDQDTEETINQGLDDVEMNTGYPDWVADDKELDKEYEGEEHPYWPMDPLTVNAHFAYFVPEVTIPAGILHRQIFNRKIPNYINYGAGAYIAGHELSHGVDYWSRGNTDGKERANECIINQAETVEEPQTGQAYSRGSLILSEMLADIGGINASYVAYKTNTKGQEQQLPGLTKYSADQLFFLAQANTWCANSQDSYIKMFMGGIGHPYNYYRVVITALNSPVFAKAYNCAAGTKMNPKDKCILW